MLNNATLNQLRELRLSAMADCFTEQQNHIGHSRGEYYKCRGDNEDEKKQADT